MDLVYHERQVGRMCAQHALNMLLQGHYFTTDNLVTVARELDQRERAVLDDETELQSQNYDDSGYFSIQVITEALRRQMNIHLEPLDSPTVLKIRQNPSIGNAYICHYDDHWFTIRKIGTTWFILNSLFKGPHIVSESFVELYITQLYAEGWSIYVVEGHLPSCAADSVPREFWVEERREKKFENDLDKAIALSMNEAQPWLALKHNNNPFLTDEHLTKNATSTSLTNQTEELELQKALEESLHDVHRQNSIYHAESILTNEALKRSLEKSSYSDLREVKEEEETDNNDPHNQQSSSSSAFKDNK